ncbi:MAG: hypothetical protein M3Y56_08995 [Armatimonadota bacterium]|nr:hypothetical protein [Armatimonadota bacterium]
MIYLVDGGDETTDDGAITLLQLLRDILTVRESYEDSMKSRRWSAL